MAWGAPSQALCREDVRLATQVQARHQQRAAEEGQSGLLLVGAHARNLAAGLIALQGAVSDLGTGRCAPVFGQGIVDF